MIVERTNYILEHSRQNKTNKHLREPPKTIMYPAYDTHHARCYIAWNIFRGLWCQINNPRAMGLCLVLSFEERFMA